MSYRSNRIALCTLAAASLALGSSAQAKLIGTSFDPPFFLGSATFVLPDTAACLGLSGGFHTVNGGSDPCTGVLLLSASVTVKDGADVAHLALPPPTPGATDVSGVVVDTESPQLVVGVNTAIIPISTVDCTGLLCDYEFEIQWNSGLPFSEFANSVLLFATYCPDGCSGDRFQFADPAVDVKFFPAPEPGSLALLAGALGVGWVVRRRRSAA